MSTKHLTTDRIFLVTYLCWMFAGCILILPTILTFMSTGIVSLLKNLGILATTLAVSTIAFRIGLRNREVILDGKTIWIRWGSHFPITLRRIETALLKDFSATKEARYAVNGRVNAPDGVRRMPDRWRLTAKVNGRNVNLGSYATEAQARDAIDAIQASA